MATAVSLIYLLLASSLAGLARIATARQQQLLIARPGEAVRRALNLTNGRLQRHGTAMLLFAVSFGLLVLLGDRGWWPEQSARVWLVIVLSLLVPAIYGLIKLVQLAAYRHRLVSLLRLHESLAARLIEAQRRGYRVHYAVTVGKACIDAVATGPNGIYALHLVMPPPAAHAAQLRGEGLQFQPQEQYREVRPALNAIAGLQRDIAAATGVRSPVQAVLVVPDCRINRGDDESALVLNLDSCVSFVGWRNPDAFLMDDELRQVDEWLGGQTVARDRAARHAAAATLGNAVRRPALV